MSRGFSRVVLVGNLGQDPEMRYSQNGTPITNFSMAVNRRRRGQDGQYQDETSWFRVTLFRQQAELAAEWLHKGNKVLVEGQLQVRKYTGQDGVERTSVDVNADNFVNLTSREESMEGGGYQQNRPAGGQGQMAQQPPRQSGARPQQQPQQDQKQNDALDDDYDLDDVPF